MVGRRNFLKQATAGIAWLIFASSLCAGSDAPVRILLLGDSTVIGSVCRKASPRSDHLEDVIRKRLAAEPGVPPVEVVNQGRDGEYVWGLLQHRYDRDIKPLGKFDLVLLRYGINDRARRENFAENFPKDYQELIAKLRADQPGVRIFIETTIPFSSPKAETEINRLITKLAETENLELIDTHLHFDEAMKRSGPQTLTYRRVKLAAVPEKLRTLIPPECLTIIRDEVVVMDNLIDAHFREVPHWFGDRHPNLAGYQELGSSIAAELAPKLRQP